MSFESDFTALIAPLANGEMYWDETPEGYVIADGALLILVQQVGGRAKWYVDQTLPQYKHARLQIEVWGRDRQAVNDMARLIEKTIAENWNPAQPYGSFINTAQTQLGLKGTRQDFGLWYSDV